jgi:porphobilinogen deaminase
MGAFAEASDDGVVRLSACIATVDGRRIIRASQSGMVDDPRSIAEALETQLVSAGAREILAQLAPRRAPKKKAKARRR